MNANDLIESYVTDVAVRLPRKQRNDVAFELRALLKEELQEKAETAGRAADADMATELLRAFGRPVDVAARYQPMLTIIDPVDGRGFLRAAWIGLAILWIVGLLIRLGQPMHSASDVLSALGQWWGATVIPSLWWPGVLVVCFGVAAWVRRRWPESSEWKPRSSDRIHGGRAALVMGLIGILCGLFVLVEPRWLLDVFFGGRAAPAAYDALTYTDTFLRRQAPLLLVLVGLNVPLLLTVLVSGRWSALMRRIELALGLVTCAALAWTVLDGPVVVAPVSDRTLKFILVLIVAYTLVDMAVRLRRRVKPSPGR